MIEARLITSYEITCDETNNKEDTISKNEINASITFRTKDFKLNDLSTLVSLLEEKMPQLIDRYNSYRIMDQINGDKKNK